MSSASRFIGHSVIDADRYRDQDEVKKDRVRFDPITRFETQLKQAGLIDDAAIKAIESRVEQEVQASIDFADKSANPKMEDMYQYMYATDVPKHH